MQQDLMICDEVVALLDVSIQAQIINLLLTLLLISHDLSLMRHVGDRMAVIYLSRIVGVGPAAQILAAPAHPYTRGLLDSVPQVVVDDAMETVFRPIQGELTSPGAPPPVAISICAAATTCHAAGRILRQL
jgi:oligopeptide/dipeptide ABC transporter ATP-binding protein